MTALRGLRGRLLLAFVATSAVTLVVAAAITLSPLQSRLRAESASALQNDTEDMRARVRQGAAGDRVGARSERPKKSAWNSTRAAGTSPSSCGASAARTP